MSDTTAPQVAPLSTPPRVNATLVASGFRAQVINGVEVWTLRGFDGVHDWQSAIDVIGKEFAAQRAAALVKPFWKTSEFWLTAASMAGGLTTAFVTEYSGSGNHFLATVAMMVSMASPFINKMVREQAKQMAAAEIAVSSVPVLDSPKPEKVDG